MHQLESASRPSIQRYGVLLWLCLAAAISYASRNALGVAESSVRADLFGDMAHLDASKKLMGLVMSLFYVSYAIGQLPGGWLADRVGSRWAIGFFAVSWSCATMLMGLVTQIWLLGLLCLVNGLFQAGLFPACTSTFAKWFPHNRRAVASGWLASSMSLGSAAATATAAMLLESVGWRYAFLIFGLIGVTWAAAFVVSFRNRPEEHPRVNEGELALIRQPEPATGSDSSLTAALDDQSDRIMWMALVLSPATWFICGQQFCRAGGQIFFATWFPTYLQESHDLSQSKSGILASVPLFAIFVGALAGGMISDWVLTITGSRRWARQGTAVVCMFVCAVATVGSSLISNSLAAVAVISSGMLFASIGGPSAYAITIDMGGRHVAKLFGCMNMVGNLGASLISFTVPQLLGRVGNWNYVLMMFGTLWLCAGIFWLLLNPNGTVFHYSFLRPRVRDQGPS